MQLKLHMVTIEDLMPQDHFLRKLDLSFAYEEAQKLYSHRYGRPPIDPVVIVKYLLAVFLYGISSERQIEQRIQTDVALRWYLGPNLSLAHRMLRDMGIDFLRTCRRSLFG